MPFLPIHRLGEVMAFGQFPAAGGAPFEDEGLELSEQRHLRSEVHLVDDDRRLACTRHVHFRTPNLTAHFDALDRKRPTRRRVLARRFEYIKTREGVPTSFS